MDPPPFSPLEAEFYLDPDDPLDAHRSVAGPLDAEYSLATKLNPLRIPLEDILQATNDFSKENLLRQDEKIAIYKGWLWWREVDVVIRKYTRYPSEFFRKIEGISRLKHRNVASLIGFCIEENVLMVVMERAVNGSLAKYINDQATLTWSQRLNICFGAALALTFRQHSSRHFYINMGDFEIMLDKDWEAKVLFCIESESKNSDLYSLGVILLEMLYGRKATIEDVNQYCYEEVDDMIDPHLRTQMHPHSLSIFSRTTYDCLKSKKRSDISPIAETLKEAFDIQWKHENRLRMESFASLEIPLRHIKLATCNFDYTYRIKSLSYDRVYKAELEHFDGGSVSTIEGDSKGELPKKRVIIERFKDNMNYPKITKDFYAKIEILSNCEHPNILTLLGFCHEDSEMVLSNITNLTWEQRIRVSLDIAHGLKFLHSREETQVLHSLHVFLNERGTAKIPNFRLSQFSSYEPWLWNAMDIAPQIPSGQRRVLDDIYSLGLTLFDILTGRLVYDPQTMQKNVNEFASMARRHFEHGELKNIADPRIMDEAQACSYPLKKGPNQDSFDTFTKIAYQCVVETPSQRPTLELVIESLEKALQFQVASDWSSCLGCVVVVCPCVGHLLCLPYEHCLKLFNYASATCYCFKLETLNSELDIC
ncbi:putative protein kinase RLK-Pelle-CR4L family [Helianthus annuus]|nr:putative protein kinase RLK-Pelle-CR4L family [Helianthus annuus]